MTPTRRDPQPDQPDEVGSDRDRFGVAPSDAFGVADADRLPSTVPARPTRVWGLSDRQRRTELDRFHRIRHRSLTPLISLPVRLALALVLLLSAAVAVWLAVRALP